MTEPALRVLCVEDEVGLREDLIAEMGDCGHLVTAAADGLVGLAIALSEPFDLILCDMRMPKLDGLAVLSELRRQGGTNSETPFVLMTAYDDASLVDEAQRLGATDFILKPVCYTALDELVRTFGTCWPTVV